MPLGRATRYAYNARNFRESIIAPVGGTTTFVHDFGVTPLVLQIRWVTNFITVFNALNQPVRTTDPIGGVTQATYDR